MEWNAFDIICGIIVLFMLVRGLARGALAEIFSVGAIIVGIAVAVIFSASLGGIVEEHLGLTNWGRIIAFFGLFLVTYIIMKIAEKTLKSFVDTVNLQNLDKALGVLLGIVEGASLVALVIFLLRLQPVFDVQNVLGGSLCVRMLDPLLISVVSNVSNV
ncbi:MAG: CvpA family protein [Spirochaetales bacterium]|jgi:membrane protein required for colicin V production|nr:CvpA family protein [Spirochaetales bacterium]